jgi:hypothetical protein
MYLGTWEYIFQKNLLLPSSEYPHMLIFSVMVYFMKLSIIHGQGHLTQIKDRRGAYRVLVGIPEEKRQLERPRHRWEEDIKMELQEVGWGGMDWINLVQDTNRCWVLVCDCDDKHSSSLKCNEFLD